MRSKTQSVIVKKAARAREARKALRQDTADEKRQPFQLPPIGWRCPKCDSIMAPAVMRCLCCRQKAGPGSLL